MKHLNNFNFGGNLNYSTYKDKNGIGLDIKEDDFVLCSMNGFKTEMQAVDYAEEYCLNEAINVR